MSASHSHAKELPLPPQALEDAEAIEVLRVWTAPGKEQQVILQPVWADPGAWGMMLVDIARHAANAYMRERHDMTREQVLERIKKLFDAEWARPTDEARDIGRQ